MYLYNTNDKSKKMKIVSKEIKNDGSELIIYLVDDNGRPILAEIVDKTNKNEIINGLLAEYFTPKDWVNDKEDLSPYVEEITYEDYISQ
jgi:hypothetical protein